MHINQSCLAKMNRNEFRFIVRNEIAILLIEKMWTFFSKLSLIIDEFVCLAHTNVPRVNIFTTFIAIIAKKQIPLQANIHITNTMKISIILHKKQEKKQEKKRKETVLFNIYNFCVCIF